ncbi:unnamed protein product [Prunus armeniaca]
MESLHWNSVWELVPKPKDRKVIGYKCVFRKKEWIREKEPTRFKDRLVANGGEAFFYTVIALYNGTMGHGSRANGCEIGVSPWRVEEVSAWAQAIFKTVDRKIIILLLYVDDMLIAYPRNRNKERPRHGQIVSQGKYISKVLERFNMLDCKPVSTPSAEHFRLSAQEDPSSDKEKDEMSKVLYAIAVGCLMYIIVCTHPDLTQAMSVVSRYMTNPSKQHWNTCYVDLDYARHRQEEIHHGVCFTCGGGPINWRVMLQLVTALFTTEEEYMAVTEASKEALWLTRLAKEFRMAQDLVVIQSDSQSAICLVKNQVFHGRSKHIDVGLLDQANHNWEVQTLLELAQSCYLLKIEVELWGLTRMIFKRLEEVLVVNEFHKVYRLAKVEIVDVGLRKDVEGVKETDDQKSYSSFD